MGRDILLRRSRNEHGASIIQVLALAGFLSLFAIVMLYLNEAGHRVQVHTTARTSVEILRQNLMAVLLTQDAWEKTVLGNDAPSSLGCFLPYMKKGLQRHSAWKTEYDNAANYKKCNALYASDTRYDPPFAMDGNGNRITSHGFKLLSPGGTVFYDVTDLRADHLKGFSLAGAANCEPFPSANCQVRYELSWGYECTAGTDPCPCPAVLITGEVRYASKESKAALNTYKLEVGPGLRIPLDPWCK